MNKTIGEKLRNLRAGTSAKKIAETLGISVSAVYMYENNERVPRDEIKKRFAEHYGKTVQEIFFDD